MVVMEVVWNRRALKDLDRIATYIAKDDPTSARRVFQGVHDTVQILADYPHAGRIGRVEGMRELVIPSFPYKGTSK